METSLIEGRKRVMRESYAILGPLFTPETKDLRSDTFKATFTSTFIWEIS